MTTNRIDHTTCSHDSTAAGRRYCRENRRRVIRAAQAGYMDFEAYAMSQDDYTELVCAVALALNIEVRDAFKLVENGPCVY